MTLKSFSYDDANYRESRLTDFVIAAGANTTSQKYGVYVATKQVKSLTFYPTTAGTSNDVVSLVQLTQSAQAFGTASVAAVSGTNTNTVVYTVGTLGSGSKAPLYVPLSGGVFVATLSNGTTTATATGTLPTGPNGGVSLGTGDIFYIQSGTDATIAMSGNTEYQFTPGTNYTA